MKVLFQGDSITDMYRTRVEEEMFGVGYPLLVKAELGFSEPGKYEFINRGVAGSRIVDLYSRIKPDILNDKPDVMSILIGVNDVWHEYTDNPNGVDADKYFKVYDLYIEEIKNAIPNIKIMIMEPFVLKASATENRWEDFSREVKKRAEMARKVAEKYDLPFIPLQKGFDELTEKMPASYWLEDGIHPTSAGHEYIKNEWVKAFKTYIMN